MSTLGGRTAAAVTTNDALVTIQRENVLKIFVYNRPFIYFELRPDNNRLLIMINASIERRYMLTSFWNLIWPKLFFCLIAIEGTIFEVMQPLLAVSVPNCTEKKTKIHIYIGIMNLIRITLVKDTKTHHSRTVLLHFIIYYHWKLTKCAHCDWQRLTRP